jgi:hypothetical protein
MTAHTTEQRKPYPARIPVSVFTWCEKEADLRKTSFNQVIIDTLRELMTLYGFSPAQAQRLQAERKRLKLSERDYIRQVLADRAEILGRQHEGQK